MSAQNNRTIINEAQSQLAHKSGREYWRSLEELAEDGNFAELVRREYPQQATLMSNALDRRNFLKLMAASLALGGITACGVHPPPEKIVPYVRQPEEITLGKPLFYATAMTLSGYATGLLVENREGHPTKVEGNPDHPASLGATDSFAQASVLTLYDPDRSQTVMRGGEISSWDQFLTDFRPALERVRARGGAGLRILTETITSPTLADQLQGLLKNFPNAIWHQYEPAARDSARDGAMLAFGEPIETIYRFDRADVVFALDSDFLACAANSVRYSRDFIFKRRVRGGNTAMNRLYAIESTPSNTGALADHRLPIKASEIENFARATAAALEVVNGQNAGATTHATDTHAEWIAALARDLQRHRGASIVIAGDYQPPQVHALAHAMNAALGNIGNTVIYTEPIEANPVNQIESLRALVRDMDAGKVEMLVMLGGNPVYTAPADFHFADSLKKIALRVHHNLYYNETSALCNWHVPETHFLETWSDARAFDGTVSIIQPLIAPLYDGKSAHEFLTVFTDQPDRSGHDIVRAYWNNKLSGGQMTKKRATSNGQTMDASQATNSASNANPSSGFDAKIRRTESRLA